MKNRVVLLPAYVLFGLLLSVGLGGCGGSDDGDAAPGTKEGAAATEEVVAETPAETAETESPAESAPIECDKENAVASVSSPMDSYAAAGPFDFSTVASAHGILKRKGTKLVVAFSNLDLSADDVANISMRTPTMAKGDWIVMLTLTNPPAGIDAGTYDPTNGYKKPYWVTADIVVKREDSDQGTILGINLDSGTAMLDGIGGGQACGSFDVSGGEGKHAVAGSFNVAVTEKM